MHLFDRLRTLHFPVEPFGFLLLITYIRGDNKTVRLVIRLAEGEIYSQMETGWKGTMTVEELIEDTSTGGPHVVVIGAGASVAALPNGDSSGKTLPVIDNLVEVVGNAAT